MDIFCKVTPCGLVPLHDSDLDLKKRLRVGSVVRCKVSNPRNYEHHKKFFALVRLTFDNLPLPLVEKWNIRNEYDMLRRFKRDLGYFTNTINEYGEHEIEYLSISFAAMEQYEFEQFYNQCIDLVLFKYIKGIDKQDLITEIENFK
ncbi:MAG: Protein of unknown function (DUF1367) [Bacteriophage sp.]|jgi:hypothetical protein|nr:MAG: Protein of unknown function (DUF1367) [Bacteriophage sp.]UWG79769.1 MAG: Protein of unknown function (DUF1367) [Bacteriophage sp.]UWH98687.1 MAG: Protein of unknown function (DUF1367) [Bacteriophage sp.]UWI27370.1 MAG: Protein of unknown function (DUF1367) [Bacteriophage sp.]